MEFLEIYSFLVFPGMSRLYHVSQCFKTSAQIRKLMLPADWNVFYISFILSAGYTGSYMISEKTIPKELVTQKIFDCEL